MIRTGTIITTDTITRIDTSIYRKQQRLFFENIIYEFSVIPQNIKLKRIE